MYNIDLVRSGRNPGGSRLKIGGPPKRVHAWLKLVFVVSRSQLRRVFFHVCDVVALFVGFWAPYKKGCHSFSFASTIVCFLAIWSFYSYTNFQVRILYTSVVELLCYKNFPCFILVPVASSQRTPDEIFHSTHESRVVALCVSSSIRSDSGL